MSKVNASAINRQALCKSAKKGGFTQISNHILLDQRLSFKARGILALLLSRPEDWQIYINEVTSKSDKDGKRAVQSGFKELVACGYLKLLPVYNDETGRFDGTYYHLEKSLFLPRQPHFRTVCKVDEPKSSPPQKQMVEKTDQPKTAELSNTNCSNTNQNNKEQQQQQPKTNNTTGVADAKNFNHYYQSLLSDQDWQQQFIGQQLNSKLALTAEDFLKLLLHFRETSLKSGTAYPTLVAIKRHFTNWFNVNLSKKCLLTYIEKINQRQRQEIRQIDQLVPKTENIFTNLKSQTVSDANQVLLYREQLLSHHQLYKNKQVYLTNAAAKQGVATLLSNVECLIGKIDRAHQLNQLSWFCQA